MNACLFTNRLRRGRSCSEWERSHQAFPTCLVERVKFVSSSWVGVGESEPQQQDGSPLLTGRLASNYTVAEPRHKISSRVPWTRSQRNFHVQQKPGRDRAGRGGGRPTPGPGPFPRQPPPLWLSQGPGRLPGVKGAWLGRQDLEKPGNLDLRVCPTPNTHTYKLESEIPVCLCTSHAFFSRILATAPFGRPV